jgi:hypothetical protein
MPCKNLHVSGGSDPFHALIFMPLLFELVPWYNRQQGYMTTPLPFYIDVHSPPFPHSKFLKCCTA